MELARECLRRRHDYERNAQLLEEQASAQRQIVDHYKSQLTLLESELAAA